MRIGTYFFCRCLALVLTVAVSATLSAAKKPKKLLEDMHFSYSMTNPGVRVVVVGDNKTLKKFRPFQVQEGKDKKTKKKTDVLEPRLTFSVWGKETVAQIVDDSTYFVRINSMQRWSVKSPVTYAVTMSFDQEKVTRSFGIRDLEVREGKIALNDTSIIRKGLTEQALPLTSLTSTDQWKLYLKDIKSQGFTVISLDVNKITEELLTAADLTGIIVHARVTPPIVPVVEEPKGKKKKKKKSKKTEEVQAPPAIHTFVGHPSLCMATMEGGMLSSSDKYLTARIFTPTSDEAGTYTQDYRTFVDSTVVCMADFSDIDDKVLETRLEKVLCTDGVGVLMFSSVEQAKVWKDVMMLGKFDHDEWDSSMAMGMDLYIANNSDLDIRNAHFSWEFSDETGFVFSNGNARGHRFLPYNTNYVATAFTPMAFVFPGSTVTLNIKMEDSDLQRSWNHKIHYPKHIRFMNDEIHRRMKDWCKRMPEESDDDYGKRVNGVTKARKKKLFAYDIVTEQAGDLVKGKAITLSRYNKNNETVTVTVDGMTPFKLKVPARHADSFSDDSDLELRNTRYSLSNKDVYEIVSTEVWNKRTGVCVQYKNEDDVETLERLFIDDKYVPETLKELADKENKSLQEIKQNVVQSAKDQNLISDYSHFDVNAHVVTDYDEKGNEQNGYCIVFEYNVEARYSLIEDYGPGRYRIEDSHAALSMLQTITQAFEKDFARYIIPGKKLVIAITGSADSSPIRGSIAYNGCYGEFFNELYYLSEEESRVTITTKDGIRQNEQLAFMRAQGVHDYLVNNLATHDMDVRYLYNIELPKGRGGKYRRIKVSFMFVDAFN